MKANEVQDIEEEFSGCSFLVDIDGWGCGAGLLCYLTCFRVTLRERKGERGEGGRREGRAGKEGDGCER